MPTHFSTGPQRKKQRGICISNAFQSPEDKKKKKSYWPFVYSTEKFNQETVACNSSKSRPAKTAQNNALLASRGKRDGWRRTGVSVSLPLHHMEGWLLIKRRETVGAERERFLFYFIFLRRGSQRSVPAMSLPAKNVKRWRETKERRLGAGGRRRRRRRGFWIMARLGFYCVSPSSCSSKDFLSRRAVNVTSAASRRPAKFSCGHKFALPFFYFFLFFFISLNAAIRSNVIFKVPSAYEVIRRAFYFNCAFLFARRGRTL